MLIDVPGFKDAVQESGGESTEQMADDEVLEVSRETDQTGSRGRAAEKKSHALATPVKWIQDHQG